MYTPSSIQNQGAQNCNFLQIPQQQNQANGSRYSISNSQNNSPYFMRSSSGSNDATSQQKGTQANPWSKNQPNSGKVQKEYEN